MNDREEFVRKVNLFVKHILPDDLKLPKVRDKKIIHDSVWGSNVFYKHEVAMLDTPLLQRLRYISQTGLVFLTFPSATHTRFEHTLGVCNLASRLVKALNEKRPFGQAYIEPVPERGEFAEMRMAALLHDCGHCFFSHASEEIYTWHPVMQGFLLDDRFAHCKPHEILSYFIVKSERFKDFFNSYVNKEHNAAINLDTVAEIIIGRHPDNKKMYHAELINGPFDADKLDYIYRDSFFSGISLTLDIDRLFYTLELDEDNFDRPYLIVRSPVPLEQILFSKMMLYTSIYHHQKVRSSECSLRALCEYIGHNNLKLNGKTISNPADYLYFTDSDILNLSSCNDETFQRLVKNILNRNLLRRGAVMCKDTIDNFEQCFEYRLVKLGKSSPSKLFELREEIYNSLPKEKDFTIHEILIDIPKLPSLREAAQTYTTANPRQQKPELINTVFPVDGWLKSYGTRKWKGHIFCPGYLQKNVDGIVREIFRQKQIIINDLSSTYCHIE